MYQVKIIHNFLCYNFIFIICVLRISKGEYTAKVKINHKGTIVRNEGENLELNCSAKTNQAFPRNLKMKWKSPPSLVELYYINYESACVTVAEDKKSRIEKRTCTNNKDGGQLDIVLIEVNFQDQGEYACDVQTADLQKFELKVLMKPKDVECKELINNSTSDKNVICSVNCSSMNFKLKICDEFVEKYEEVSSSSLGCKNAGELSKSWKFIIPPTHKCNVKKLYLLGGRNYGSKFYELDVDFPSAENLTEASSEGEVIGIVVGIIVAIILLLLCPIYFVIDHNYPEKRDKWPTRHLGPLVKVPRNGIDKLCSKSSYKEGGSNKKLVDDVDQGPATKKAEAKKEDDNEKESLNKKEIHLGNVGGEKLGVQVTDDLLDSETALSVA